MSTQPATIEMIKIIAIALGDLNDRAVFVSGAAVPFYLPEAYLSLVRPTEDIDVVMVLAGRLGGSTTKLCAQKILSTTPVKALRFAVGSTVDLKLM